MLQPRLIVGNWKMHKTIPEAKALVEGLSARIGRQLSDSLTAVLAPPFTALSAVAQMIQESPFLLGAQDLHWEDEGAYTGEVSGRMLRDAGCRYVIVGHSERRRYFGESDAMVQKKVLAALRHGLQPILCIGETGEQRNSNQTEAVLTMQLTEGLAKIEKSRSGEMVIAYEPVWAIGSGRAATPEQARDAHQHIRAHLISLWGQESGARVPILYGGSITPDNIGALLAMDDVDGGLVGGACLDPELFAKILRIASAPQGSSSEGRFPGSQR